MIAWAISVGSGCSFAVRRSAVLALGGFDEALDLGPPLPGGGDLDLLWRILDAGHEVVYDPSVQAWHEHRRERNAAVRQIIDHNRSLIAMLSKSAVTSRRGTRAAVACFLAWRLMKPGVRLLRRVAGSDPLPAGAILELWKDSWRGLTAYREARQLAEARRRSALTPAQRAAG